MLSITNNIFDIQFQTSASLHSSSSSIPPLYSLTRFNTISIPSCRRPTLNHLHIFVQSSRKFLDKLVLKQIFVYRYKCVSGYTNFSGGGGYFFWKLSCIKSLLLCLWLMLTWYFRRASCMWTFNNHKVIKLENSKITIRNRV